MVRASFYDTTLPSASLPKSVIAFLKQSLPSLLLLSDYGEAALRHLPIYLVGIDQASCPPPMAFNHPSQRA